MALTLHGEKTDRSSEGEHARMKVLANEGEDAVGYKT